MYEFIYKTIQKKFLADNITPIEFYSKIRNYFPNTLLLEYYNYKINKNNYSIICINPISEIIIDSNKVKIFYPNENYEFFSINKKIKIYILIDNFLKKFRSINFTTIYSGLYGYISYESVQYFEKIKFNNYIKDNYRVPQIRFNFYSNLIIFHNIYNKFSIIEHKFPGKTRIKINKLLNLIHKKKFIYFSFNIIENLSSNLTDFEYKKMVNLGKKSCLKGEIFQIVLSRQFQQKFIGDEFNVYRILRYINPSPYLFYFDYSNYKLFGSSPESQLIIKNKKAYIYPIAGTIKRSGNNKKDKKLAKYLIKDAKENSEHVMLVDLARNDLSKNSLKVKVEKYKKIKYFSHVLHMVSKVSGKLKKNIYPIKIFIDTFPAGTLSGAPKYRAMELIDKIENQHRGLYGGSIGFLGLNGNINTAIIIRSFVSKNNILFFQAGGGVVYKSKKENELQEINNKLMALNKAIKSAINI